MLILFWQNQAQPIFLGLPGPQGLQGPAGTSGTSGISGYEIVTANDTIGSAFENGKVVNVFCKAGKKVLGGGCGVGSDISQTVDSLPSTTGWACHFNTGGINEGISAYAICANVQ
jgi:hypothetical protein